MLKYPEADIFVIQECEDPYFYEDEDYKRLFINGFRIGSRSKGLAVIARDGITLRRLCWHEVGDMSFAPVKVDESFTIVPIWTHGKYVEEIHDFLDLNFSKYDERTIMLGDYNSSVIFDKEHRKRSHTMLIERMAEIGHRPIYHFINEEKQGEESIPTLYFRRKKAESFHIDHAFADHRFVRSMEIAPLNTHDSWLTLSDHMPMKVEVDTDLGQAKAQESTYTSATLHARPISELKPGKTPQPKMSIRMPDGRLIRREKMTDTFRDFIMGMGWEAVRDMNFDVYGKDLITQEHPDGWYKELVPGWYVNTGMKANTMRITAYEIARAFGKKIVVSWD